MKTKYLYLLLLCIVMSACSKDDAPLDPQKAILGKWEFVGYILGGQPEYPNQPKGYVEYLNDSLMKWNDYSTGEYKTLPGKYWIDSLLHYKDVEFPDIGHGRKFMYEFYDDKMELVSTDMINITSYAQIFQRK